MHATQAQGSCQYWHIEPNTDMALVHRPTKLGSLCNRKMSPQGHYWRPRYLATMAIKNNRVCTRARTGRGRNVIDAPTDTLIVWTEPSGVDMALSFQEADGCSQIWYVSTLQSLPRSLAMRCLCISSMMVWVDRGLMRRRRDFVSEVQQRLVAMHPGAQPEHGNHVTLSCEALT